MTAPTPTSNTAPANLEELARIHDLAFEMLSILESISRREHLMEWELESGIAYRIRRVLKEAHGE